MARVRQFNEVRATARPHPTEVDCGWQVVRGREALLQLSTYGSDHRVREPKVSQTLQIDEKRAAELMDILRKAFPHLR